MRSHIKAQPLCSKPVSGVFTGRDNYLKLQDVTVREPMPPIAEDDSLLIYVTGGTGHITINGVVFDLRPGAFCWLQSYHVFSLEPDRGSELQLQVLVYDYPLSSYMTYRPNRPQGSLCFPLPCPYMPCPTDSGRKWKICWQNS